MPSPLGEGQADTPINHHHLGEVQTHTPINRLHLGEVPSHPKPFFHFYTPDVIENTCSFYFFSSYCIKNARWK